MMSILSKSLLTLVALMISGVAHAEDQLKPIKYNNPGLVVDLGVGLWAWPLPMDYDDDGDMDLIVSCPDVPFSGTYFFENGQVVESLRGKGKKSATLPVFEPPVRIADKMSNVQVSYIAGRPIVSTSGKIFLDFPKNQYSKPINLGLPTKLDLPFKRTRANQWKLVDWENDGDLDVIVGLGVWDEYGWDDAWDDKGNWKNGPLHGYVYLVENLAIEGEKGREGEKSSTKTVWKSLPAKEAWPNYLGPRPKFSKPVQIEADGKPVDVYGMPSPNFADFDEDGDLDLICGEFMDGFTWFENKGSREKPNFHAGAMVRQTSTRDEEPRELKMDLQMITPVAIDWDRDGDVDIICGDEDGRVAILERYSDFEKKLVEEGRKQELFKEGYFTPAFSQPIYFHQKSEDVKFGALVTPVGVDWDGDGDQDILCGNTAGYFGFIENLDAAENPKFASPVRIQELLFRSGSATLSSTLRYRAGPKGSIQGPCESKWGYSTISVSDWDHDGRMDIVGNGIWGKVKSHLQSDKGSLFTQYINVHHNKQPLKPDWAWWTPKDGQLATQWRTTPCTLDWNDDSLTDIVMLDHEGYLAFYERTKKDDGLILEAPQRIFKIEGKCEFDSRHRNVGEKKDDLLRLNAGHAGASGRRKLHFVDWDGDGRKDLLVNSTNVNWLKNVRTDKEGFVWFKDMGPMDTLRLAGHTTSPTTVDWDQNGIPDLLVGAEDGRMYYKKNPRTK